MVNSAERSEILTMLRAPDVEERVAILKDLIYEPTGDAQVRAAVGSLLDDRSACIVQIPLLIGEVCWLAAHALAAERSAAHITEAVQVNAVVRPMEAGELAELALTTSDIEARQLSLLDWFEKLRTMGQLSTMNLEIKV